MRQEGVEEEQEPVVVVHLGHGGGGAWGVSPDAAVEIGDQEGARPSWQAFREEVRCLRGVVGSGARV